MFTFFFCYSYRDDRDRHRQDDKNRLREKERREREYEAEKDRDRYERYERRSIERKKSRKSLSPYSQKSTKDLSPERSAKKKEKDHEEKVEEKKKEKKIKEKKKKKDSDEKEKKKKKKKDKKSNQKEASKEDHSFKVTELTTAEDTLSSENKATDIAVTSSPMNKIDSVKMCNEVDNIENRIECISNEALVAPVKEEFEDKSLAINPEPPEFNEPSPGSGRLDRTEFCTNPPNPNFKPIPELKSDMKPIESLYGGLDDAEINTVITEKYSLLSEHPQVEMKETTPAMLPADKSPKKDEFLAPIPELSKWERDETIEKTEDNEDEDADRSPAEKIQRDDEPKSTKMVTSEVLKRAENAIFQKAINAIRPIEIKKISESRKILYQNPEPKVLETAEPANREARKSVNVTINVGRNERNVEITEPVKKTKLDRTKFKPVPETPYSPTRLSAKERLGEKVEDNKERKVSPMKGFLERRDGKSESQSRSRSPRREKRISPLLERRVEPSSLGLNTSGERKVFLEERKRDAKDRGDRSKERSEFRGDRHSGEMRSERESKIDCRTDYRSNRNDIKGGEHVDKDRERERDRERRGRTPPSCTFKKTEMPKINLLKSRDDEEEKRRDKKPREEKKRKKEHRSRSKSKEHKKRKEKKHKKDKDKNQEKKQKHKESTTSKDKLDTSDTKIAYEKIESPLTDSLKKQRKNPRLISDRKRSMLDEASFEPDYSASDSESDGDDGKMLLPAKKLKLDETDLDKEMEIKSAKKRSKSSSSEDESSSSDTTSSDSDSSDESHKKKRKKHKKHKKKKSARKNSSSDSDTYSDSSDSSSDEEKHKKKSKKSKSRSKQSKKKKKSKHK